VTRPLTAAERQRLRTSANLWRALVPLLVVVGIVVAFTWPRGQHADGVHVVDVTAPIAAAKRDAGLTLAPAGLSQQWRPTSTKLVAAGPANGASFRIGYVSPSGRYAEFLESNDAPAAVAATYGPLSTVGKVQVGGSSWEQYQTQDGHPLLRTTVGNLTVIVTGSAAMNELVEFASSVH
jgi:hypothetical protein